MGKGGAGGDWARWGFQSSPHLHPAGQLQEALIPSQPQVFKDVQQADGKACVLSGQALPHHLIHKP